MEDDIHLGDIWRIGEDVRLEVCGSRIPCMKVSWRFKQKEQWLQTLAASGRVGVYLRVLGGGRVRPGDDVVCEKRSDSSNAIDCAAVTRLAYDADLRTRDTLDLLANHELLLSMNKTFISWKLAALDDKLNLGRNAWKGWRDLRVDRVVDEGAGVKSFYLGPGDEHPLANYLPGQFLSVRLPGGNVRSWTISDWPSRSEPPYYRLTIKKEGVSSSWMHDECGPGMTLAVRSPAGRFHLDWNQKLIPRQIYVSAGIGLTPMLAMMKAHASHPLFHKSPALWIHVARDAASVPATLTAEMPRFEGRPSRKITYFTRPRMDKTFGVDKNNDNFAGRPDFDELRRVIAAPYTWKPLTDKDLTMEGKMSFAYVCGPPEFEESARQCLLEAGIPQPFVHSESFTGSGAAAASHAPGELKRATVRFTKSGVEAVWTKDKPVSLLELAESAGLTPDYGCRVGSCESCASRLVRGDVSGRMLLDGNVLTCSAMPASEVVEIEV